LKATVAVRAPTAVGVKVTLMVQLALAATLEPQVLLAMLKSPGLAPEVEMELMVRALVPVLVRVTVCGGLVVPTVWLANGRVVGDRLTKPVVPVPFSATFWGLVGSASLIQRVAERVPPSVGVNVTVTVQLPPAGTLEPQVLVWLKSPGLVPVNVMELMVSTLPELVRVTILEELVFPTPTLPKFSERGVTDTAVLPEPARLTLCGLLEALSTMLTVALSEAMVEGVKVTVMVQLELIARLDGQLSDSAKSEALAPVTLMLVMERGAVAVLPLVRVAVLGALVVPYTTVPKEREVGETLAAGATPVPLRLTYWVLGVALSFSVRLDV
jgi:hypothetical protein